MKKLKNYEILGIIIIVILGTLFHFAYDLINRFRPLAFIFPINESVWEHMKMVFWPMLFFGGYEATKLKISFRKVLAAKTYGIYISIIFIIVLHYGYKAILGTHLVILDIFLFVLAIIIGQAISYKILMKRRPFRKSMILSYFLFVLLLFAIVYFSYYPPQLFLFISS